MRGIPGPHRRAAALIAAFLAIGCLGGPAPAFAASQITLAWAPNTDPDLAGYRLYYATRAGAYPGGSSILVGNVTTYEFDTLSAARTYYFAVTALDVAGNESQPSDEISGTPANARTSQPTVTSAVDLATDSIYLARGGTSQVRITGTDFQPGATVLVPIGVPGQPTTFESATSVIASLPVPDAAPLGSRGMTIINPDGGLGRLDGALEVVKNPDLNQDCAVDIIDLNVLARSWHLTSADPGYVAAADLNDDDYVDGDDLSILVKFIGVPPGSCP